MAGIDNIPPIDNTAYHFFCRYHGGWPLDKGSDSVAASEGLNDINRAFNNIDTKLKTIQTNGATPAPDCYTAVWRGSSTQNITSSSTVVNGNFTWTNVFTLSGTPTLSSFNTTTGQFSLGTAGYWRITYHMYTIVSAAETEGYVSVVLKDASLGAYPVRSIHTVPLETRIGATSVFKSVLYRCATTGNIDLAPSTTYVLSAFQENNLVANMNIGGSDTWISIEYVRPL